MKLLSPVRWNLKREIVIKMKIIHITNSPCECHILLEALENFISTHHRIIAVAHQHSRSSQKLIYYNFFVSLSLLLHRVCMWLQLSGGLFLALGLWLHLSNQGYATLYPTHMGLSAEYLFILIGALSVVISFFGCCGSFFESRCCLVIVSWKTLSVIGQHIIASVASVERVNWTMLCIN